MENYQVGQIIFLIGEKSIKVLPIQVVEEVVRTTVDGKIKTYTVKMPDQKQTTADIQSLKGQLFKDEKTLRLHMLENAKNAIDNMIQRAQDLSSSMFEQYADDGNAEEALPESTQDFSSISVAALNGYTGPSDTKAEDVQIKKEDGIIKVDLGNGQFAKMNTKNLDQIKQ